MLRRGSAFAAVGVAVLVLAGCTGSPAATESSTAVPTGSASGTGTVSAASTGSTPSSSGASSSGASSSGASSAGSIPSTATAGTGDTTSAVPAEITPVLASVSTEPIPVTGTDGRVYLVYELYLTNSTSTPVAIDSVQALDSDSGAVLQARSGDDLVTHTRVVGQEPGRGAPTSVVLDGGQLAIVWVDPSVEAGADVPTSLRHQVKVTFESAPNPLVPAELTETVAATSVRAESAPTISPPMSGQNWLDANGCCDEITPHRGAANPINGQFFFAERFAVDWVQLDGDNRFVSGPGDELSSYAYYGSPIVAVADGTIDAVSDELQDQTPGANPPAGSLQLDQYSGNYVVQRFEQGGQTYYALYAHLKPGSAKAAVSVGQAVQTGDQLGELGNSGNTSAPHLHFHVMDGPDPLASNGLPYQFDSLQLVGQATGDDAVSTGETGQAIPLVSDGLTGTRTGAMPLYLDIVGLSVPASASTSSGAGSTTRSSSRQSAVQSSTTASPVVPSAPSITPAVPSGASVTSSSGTGTTRG